MQIKKYDKANLEKLKILFILVGLNLALIVCYAAFEHTSKNLSTSSLGDLSVSDVTEEEIDATQQEELPPEVEQQEPEQEPEQVIEELVIVENTEQDTKININTEADEKTKTVVKVVETSISNVVPEDEYIEPISFAIVEEKPSFPGGDEALLKFIRDNTVYPPTAKDLGIQGRVYIQFVIDKNGHVTNIQVARSVDPYLDKEALRVVALIPNWSPGKQRGKAVPVTYLVPINFKLN